MKLREIQQRVDGPEPAGLRGTHETSRDGAARWSAPLPQPWRWEIQARMGGSASAGPRPLLLLMKGYIWRSFGE